MTDFRYEKGGEIVEGFQLTPASRYQEKMWPEWMDSHWLMTIDQEEWLNISDVETRIPNLGWIVKMADGRVTAVDYSFMETAVKVVKETPVVHPEAKVDEEALIQLAAKISNRDPEDIRAEQNASRQQPEQAVEVMVGVPGPAPLPPPANDDGLLTEIVMAYELLKDEHFDAGMEALKKSASRRVVWCNCAPGFCDNGDPLGCRQKSPLI